MWQKRFETSTQFPSGRKFLTVALDFMRFQEQTEEAELSKGWISASVSTQALKEQLRCHQDSHSHPSAASWTHLLLWRQPSSICFLYMRHIAKHYYYMCTKQPSSPFPLAQTNPRTSRAENRRRRRPFHSLQKILTLEWNQKKRMHFVFFSLSFAIWCLPFFNAQ